jgi:hypothetical protein
MMRYYPRQDKFGSTQYVDAFLEEGSEHRYHREGGDVNGGAGGSSQIYDHQAVLFKLDRRQLHDMIKREVRGQLQNSIVYHGVSLRCLEDYFKLRYK